MCASWNNLFPFVDFYQQGHKARQVMKRLYRLALGQAGGRVLLFNGFYKLVQTQTSMLCSRIEFLLFLEVAATLAGCGQKQKNGCHPFCFSAGCNGLQCVTLCIFFYRDNRPFSFPDGAKKLPCSLSHAPTNRGFAGQAIPEYS